MTSAWSAFPMLDRLFDDVMTGIAGTAFGAAATARAFSPAVDVRANEDEIVLVADVPGVKKEDLEVTLEDGVLTIKGQRRYEGSDKEKVWLGRSYGSFERSFTLPETVDPDRLTADLADGVLTIRIAQQPKAKPKKIAINAHGSAPGLEQETSSANA